MEAKKEHIITQKENEVHQGHISSYRDLIGIWIGLMILTFMTVAVSVYGGRLATMAVTTALFIATGKSLVVANHFMHMKFDKPLFRTLGLIVVILFVSLILFTVIDYATR